MLDGPVYDVDGIQIWHGDALEVLPSIRSARFVITDPPYIIGAVSSGYLTSKSGTWADMMNSSLWFATWYKEVGRLLLHDGAFWSFLNWRTLPVVMKAHVDARLPLSSLMVWNKMSVGQGGQRGLRPAYELLTLCAGGGFAIPDRGTRDIIDFPWSSASSRESDHPAEKPVGLVRKILELSGAQSGDVVVDPFLGSGTTALAARSLGLRCIGIEADDRHVESAITRLGQTAMQFD